MFSQYRELWMTKYLQLNTSSYQYMIDMMVSQHTPSVKSDSRSSYLYELPPCSICLHDLSEGISTLSCGHCFHRECLDKLFENTCPICRLPFKKYSIVDLIYQSVLVKQNQLDSPMMTMYNQTQKIKADHVSLKVQMKRMKQTMQFLMRQVQVFYLKEREPLITQLGVLKVEKAYKCEALQKLEENIQQIKDDLNEEKGQHKQTKRMVEKLQKQIKEENSKKLAVEKKLELKQGKEQQLLKKVQRLTLALQKFGHTEMMKEQKEKKTETNKQIAKHARPQSSKYVNPKSKVHETPKKTRKVETEKKQRNH